MPISRRGFLRGSLAVGALAFLPDCRTYHSDEKAVQWTQLVYGTPIVVSRASPKGICIYRLEPTGRRIRISGDFSYRRVRKL